MPLYDYYCKACDKVRTEQRTIGNRLAPPARCGACRREMDFVIMTAPSGIVRNPAAGPK